MSVYLGKILWAFVAPANFIFGLLLVSLLLACWRRTRLLGIKLGGAAAVVILLIGLLPVGEWLLLPLEDYFPRTEPPAAVDGIVLLGGSEEAFTSDARGYPELNNAGDRMIAFAALARQYPQARLIYTGGGVQWTSKSYNELFTARAVFKQLGMDLERIRLDGSSRNTADNVRQAKILAQPKSGETWLLITSAAHMPRAVNCFLAVGWPVMPFVVDYRTPASPLRFEPFYHFIMLNYAAREWVGLIAYRLLGHTQTFLPSRTIAVSKASNIAAEAWPRRSQ